MTQIWVGPTQIGRASPANLGCVRPNLGCITQIWPCMTQIWVGPTQIGRASPANLGCVRPNLGWPPPNLAVHGLNLAVQGGCARPNSAYPPSKGVLTLNFWGNLGWEFGIPSPSLKRVIGNFFSNHSLQRRRGSPKLPCNF